MGEGLRRFLGDSPIRVAVRLAFLSLIVGVVMSSLDIQPWDLVTGFREFVFHLWDRSAEIIQRAVSYLALGAVVVVPVWLIVRLLGSSRRH